jgi:hypothetical protein
MDGITSYDKGDAVFASKHASPLPFYKLPKTPGRSGSSRRSLLLTLVLLLLLYVLPKKITNQLMTRNVQPLCFSFEKVNAALI